MASPPSSIPHPALLALALLFCIRTSLPATPDGTAPGQTLRAVAHSNRVDVFVADQLFTSYLFGPDLKYPYFYPVIGPRTGRTVTTHRTEPYPHHSSLFFGCDRVNGGNYWQEGLDRGQIVSTEVRLLRDSGPGIELEQTCTWQRPDAPTPFTDTRRILITAPTPDRRCLDFEITLTAKTRVRIEKTNHSLFAIRMAPDLAVTGGGLLHGDNGKSGEQATFGRRSPWMDARGKRGEATEGVTLFNHPSNPWSPPQWFTRDYGFLSPTPFNWLDAPFELAEGQSLHLRYRVLVHADNPADDALQTLYETWPVLGNDPQPSAHVP